MFSVLSSIYHKEHPAHFNACMESIWDKQTLKPTEIVLIEDGPLSPELDQIIAKWQEKLGKVLHIKKLEKNVGTGKAKNIGLQECTYDIVCIVDTDDIYVPERFEKQIKFLEKNPDVSIVGGQILEFVEDTQNPTGMRNVPLSNEDLRNYAKKQSPFNNMTITYRKSHILEVGGYQHHLWMEDYNLFLRVIAKGHKIQNLPDVLVYARIDNGMHGRRKGFQYIKSEKQLLDLKKQLKLQNPLYANMLFLVRSAFRLLPANLLGKIYNTFLRKDIKK
ncbi:MULTISPECIES: glycosyltransferase [Acinetobacter calcoaceticus/baumannii complex]|uniref:glycosyltransferase n=1 Tax=Acinetobacter calcoaceticus/baumannii complex TaxID=909768 RepID=UPI000445CAEB|nr:MULTISPECIES: glycosyltransferase [Acinetobacter calcoaceticus/baumannii complex]EXE58333.1 glycosyl transferase 2 family protein [Acinetobacter sp. 1542444]MEC6393621.1 glycosyltransferase [Acinetobacter pittii]